MDVHTVELIAALGLAAKGDRVKERERGEITIRRNARRRLSLALRAKPRICVSESLASYRGGFVGTTRVSLEASCLVFQLKARLQQQEEHIWAHFSVIAGLQPPLLKLMLFVVLRATECRERFSALTKVD